MLTDIEIAQAAKLKKISDVASTLGINADDLMPYGHHMAKLSQDYIGLQQNKPNGKLILVTAMSPTQIGRAHV